MSKESRAFLKATHLMINETVDCAMHALRGSNFTLNDRLGVVLEEKDVDILRNIDLSSEEIDAIKLLLKAVGQLSVTGVLGAIDGAVMISEIDLPDLSLINRATGLDISDEALLNEEFYEVSEDD